MHPAAKVVIGVILVIGSIWWIIQGSYQFTHHSGLSDLRTVLNGIIPVLILILGVFVIWIEMDEMKIEKELKRRKR